MKFFVVVARGHPLIKAIHKSTFEITKDNYLTPNGDCIIGICASHAVCDLPEDLKEHLKFGGKIRIILEVCGNKDEIIAYGHPSLKLVDKRSIVVRKSDYIDARTLAIRANKAARDINRDLIKKLKEGRSLRCTILW
ncbi:MAG TPA: DUF371 domain-containing protein [Candidatus Nanopusillus sp.]|nr:DUF371 domain-containing protein [Candidatus Nanopusillus sp.]